jgi:hypothetical protein
MLKKLATASIAAISLVSATTAVAAPSASRLSVASSVRAGADEGDSRLAGGSGAIIAALLVVGIIAIPLIDELSSDDDDSPASP